MNAVRGMRPPTGAKYDLGATDPAVSGRDQLFRNRLFSAAPPKHSPGTMDDRFGQWLLLSGQRYLVAGLVLGLMLVVALVPVLSSNAIRNTTPLSYMASALVTTNVTLVTLVVAINQVILSQELESPDSLREEIEGTATYRQEALGGKTAPTAPAAFLSELLEQTRDQVAAVEELIPDSSEEADYRLLTDLPEHCASVADRLESVEDDLARVILPILGVDYASYIHDCTRLEASHEGDDHEELRERLDDLASDLENLDVARQYFTTAFMKGELATLSRLLLYVAILAVSVPVALLFQLTTYPGAAPPMPALYGLALAAALFGLLPLALLIAFVLRIATVAQRIAVISPFQA